MYQAMWKSLSFHAFLVSFLLDPDPDAFFNTVPKLVAEGALKYREHVTKGLENGGQAFQELFVGKNFGKAVIIIE